MMDGDRHRIATLFAIAVASGHSESLAIGIQGDYAGGGTAVAPVDRRTVFAHGLRPTRIGEGGKCMTARIAAFRCADTEAAHSIDGGIAYCCRAAGAGVRRGPMMDGDRHRIGSLFDIAAASGHSACL